MAAGAANLLALDRNAFTVTDYRLTVMIDRGTSVMTVDGQLTLRNDAKEPQKNVALQVSSAFTWSRIALNNQPLQYLGEPYTSDIDHTGKLSEAIVTLPNAVAPTHTVTLGVQYGGAIKPDTTRLTRMGVPQELASNNDWDQISPPFTVVRGLGYVVWYPVSVNAVSLSDGNAFSDAIAQWKDRQRNTVFDAKISAEMDATSSLAVVTNVPDSGLGSKETLQRTEDNHPVEVTFATNQLHLDSMGTLTPVFAVGSYTRLQRPSNEVLSTTEHALIAKDYSAAAEASDSLLSGWLPQGSTQPLRIIELPDPNASPYQDGATLFTPLISATQQNEQLLLLPTQVAARFRTPRPWMQKGLGLFMQAILVRESAGRDAAIKFLDQYEAPLAKAEELAHAPAAGNAKLPPASESDNSLLSTSDELYLRVKGGFVFWMLHDMLGDSAMQHAFAAYRPEADNLPTYFQKLLEAPTKHDLEWFFDDWVYRDRGLPNFHIESGFSRKLLSEGAGGYQVTVTIENLGAAGASVPVLFQTARGEKSMRVVVHAHDKGYPRIELPELPTGAVVNDGSVPEADTKNNTYKFENKPES